MAEETKPTMTIDLSGQTAIVTGASQGLGQAMALAIGRSGAKVACVARTVDKLTSVVDQINAAGGTAKAWPCDVTKKESVEAVVEGVVGEWGKLDILVNNAGVTKDTLLPRMSDEQWDDVINTNLRGTFLFCRAASMHMMRARYGRIINVSSVSGLIGNGGQCNYSASKAGIIGFTRSMSKELAGRKVCINAIAPGFIESEMTKVLGDAIIQMAKDKIPAKRLGRAEEIADAVLFLASPNASYITGAVLTVDGGLTG